MRATISAEEVFSHIYLLTEILLRLPLKSLVKFKCVSKHWRSVISDSQFGSQFFTPSALLLKNKKAFDNKSEIIPLKHDTIPPEVPSFDYFNAASGFCIRQSYNGLLLCSSYYICNEPPFPTKKLYYICNPTTKHLKRLSYSGLQYLAMAFDPLKSNHYKLIHVGKKRWTDECHVSIYSSETDSWSCLEKLFTRPYGVDFDSPVFCNGAIHWYSSGKTSPYFDVDGECFRLLPMPNLAQGEFKYFGESRGHLHPIVTESPSPLQFDVLKMEDDYSGWSMRYHVNLDDAVRIQFPENQKGFSVLHVVRAQKQEESIIVVLFEDGKIISYNFRDGTSKKLSDLERPVNYRRMKAFPYFESLISV